MLQGRTRDARRGAGHVTSLPPSPTPAPVRDQSFWEKRGSPEAAAGVSEQSRFPPGAAAAATLQARPGARARVLWAFLQALVSPSWSLKPPAAVRGDTRALRTLDFASGDSG